MLQKRYIGFLNTPFLWKSNSVANLNQFEIVSKSNKIDISIDETLRLGKYVERFVSFELEQHENISILAENVQIQDNKITLGELDCLLLKDNKPIHLEIIYKLYLYDSSVGANEIDHLIGPNRKDSLKEKITKLKEKQLPLLNTPQCENYLKTLSLTPEDISQQVYFKAQLFVPFSNQDVQLKTLNSKCIVGFYINRNQLNQFNDCKFYVPKKKDWLVRPHTNLKWLNFNEFEIIAKDYFEQQFSPLCWVKFKNGELKKMFLVWW
ncbi:DUF1853 family protein [Flavivirga eckloniae]|uniref:DUF1853 domain-containing protein n=1 Tax=Flavivirga eckloniae TaxID=1803846 RepID=A0A2K9PS94_9FLAO|nr:DUF1853 family protein [Flavivirga eckloniae]AUP79943.1 DUF1853 domain-containing protein [Flavivirga eckloniae]